MKINFCLPFVGVCLALVVSGAGAQNVAAPLESPKSKPTDAMANPQLLGLRAQLSALVIKEYPDAQVEFLGDALVIQRRSANSATHLFTPFEDTFPSDAIQFPADFSEFIIRVSAEDGFMAAGLKQNAGTTERAYGTFDSSVYAWNSTRSKYRDFYFNDIPMTSWVYPALYRLSHADLIERPSPIGSVLNGSRPFTVYEVTISIARALDNAEARRKLAVAPESLKQDFADLRMAFPLEFLSDMRGRDEKQNFQTQALWLTFAYGKGVAPNFINAVKQTVAAYALANFTAN